MQNNITKRIGLILLLLSSQLNIEQVIAQTKPSTPAKTVEVNPAICPAQLGKAIETITNRPQFSQARWGVVVNKLNNSQSLYSRDSDKYFIPASNLKLLLAAAALQQLGANYRIRTSIYGTDNGLLRVVGRGDPSLTDVQLTALARQLKLTRVRQLTYLTVDKGDRADDIINPEWEWGDIQADYGAPIGNLILNQNAVTLQLLPQQIGQPLRLVWSDPIAATQWQRIDNQSLTAKPGETAEVELNRDLSGILHLSGRLSINSPPETVSLAVIDPAENFIQHLRRALLTEGIKDNRSRVRLNIVEVEKQLAKAPEIAAVNSPPLSQLLLEANLNSNNLYAEALLRTLGSKVNSSDSNLQKGLIVAKQALTTLGIDPKGYVMADGSGLSRHNLVSPKAIAQTLVAMANSPYAAIYRASLPVAGISGTMSNRLKNTPAQGVVSAKTGTMSGNLALSGYINAPNYEPLVFSIIINQSDQSAATIRQAIDEIVLVLVSLRRC
jgi:serine-type D-Ala-D-Ala carboxypeptidase/endopeptidase (penicillin-binding protein 4)